MKEQTIHARRVRKGFSRIGLVFAGLSVIVAAMLLITSTYQFVSRWHTAPVTLAFRAQDTTEIYFPRGTTAEEMKGALEKHYQLKSSGAPQSDETSKHMRNIKRLVDGGASRVEMSTYARNEGLTEEFLTRAIAIAANNDRLAVVQELVRRDMREIDFAIQRARIVNDDVTLPVFFSLLSLGLGATLYAMCWAVGWVSAGFLGDSDR